MAQDVWVTGVGMIPFTKPGASAPYPVMAAEATRAALTDAGLDYAQVQQRPSSLPKRVPICLLCSEISHQMLWQNSVQGSDLYPFVTLFHLASSLRCRRYRLPRQTAHFLFSPL